MIIRAAMTEAGMLFTRAPEMREWCEPCGDLTGLVGEPVDHSRDDVSWVFDDVRCARCGVLVAARMAFGADVFERA